MVLETVVLFTFFYISSIWYNTFEFSVNQCDVTAWYTPTFQYENWFVIRCRAHYAEQHKECTKKAMSRIANNGRKFLVKSNRV